MNLHNMPTLCQLYAIVKFCHKVVEYLITLHYSVIKLIILNRVRYESGIEIDSKEYFIQCFFKKELIKQFKCKFAMIEIGLSSVTKNGSRKFIRHN